MSKVQMLRALVNVRLTAAVEDIFGVFERTIEEYEEEVSSSKQEISRQRKLLDAILKPEIRLQRADPQQLFGCKEGVPPEQQEWSPSLGQEEPEPPQIKEEQEELIEGLVPTLTLLPENSENNEEEQSSQLNPTQTEENREAEPPASTSTEQMKPEPDGEDCAVSEPASNLDPVRDLEPTSDDQLFSSGCRQTEVSDDDWKETREPQSGLNTLKANKIQRVEGQSVSVINMFRRSMEPSHELKPSNQIPSLVGCKVCGRTFLSKISLKKHVMVHSSGCGLCGKHLEPRESLELHFQSHKTCTICSKKFSSISKLERHMQVHTGQRPFSCSVCGKRFGLKYNLKTHMIVHTGEKLFSCSICGKRFGEKGTLKTHMRVHTGERPYSCSVCGKSFQWQSQLKSHKCVSESSSR